MKPKLSKSEAKAEKGNNSEAKVKPEAKPEMRKKQEAKVKQA